MGRIDYRGSFAAPELFIPVDDNIFHLFVSPTKLKTNILYQISSSSLRTPPRTSAPSVSSPSLVGRELRSRRRSVGRSVPDRRNPRPTPFRCRPIAAREAALKKRRTYYAAEAVVRESRKLKIEQARPEPEHPCPSATELTEAYTRRHESEDWKVRFGTLMINLEEHVRRTFIHSGNKFTGSSGGVKEWLARECPLLARHYSTCQRFKRILQDEPETNSGT